MQSALTIIFRNCCRLKCLDGTHESVDFGLFRPPTGGCGAALFKEADPWGFILFKRNIGTPDEVRSLTASLRDCVGRADVPILIDQEGGRVQRMRAPHWTSYPAGSVYGQLAEQDPLMRRALAWQGARLIAHDLYEVGINVNCAPILMCLLPGLTMLLAIAPIIMIPLLFLFWPSCG